MKYRVEVGYRTYIFDNGQTALSYAEMTKANAEQDQTVTIEIIKEEGKEE